MKKISIIKGLIKKNKIIVFIICIQFFFAMFVSIFKLNRLKMVSEDLYYLSKKPVANSLLYMKKYPYSLIYKDKRLDNKDKIDENSVIVETFVKDRKDLFKGISPSHIRYYDKENLSTVYMYDNITMENMDKYIIEGGLEEYEEGKPIPALVTDKFRGDYKIGSIFSLNFGDKSYEFKVTGFYSSNIRHFSTGKVAIARALVNNPDLILADEPTGAVDEETSKEILDLFDKLVTGDRAIIVVTHDINVAGRAKIVYEMLDGKLMVKNNI